MVSDVSAKHGDVQGCVSVPMCLCVFSVCCVYEGVWLFVSDDSGLTVYLFILAMWSRRCL